MKTITILLLVIFLAAGVVGGWYMLYPILAAILMYFLFGLYSGFRAVLLLRSMWEGMRRSLTVVLVVTLIGVMSGLWRSCGLMALLVEESLAVLYPPLFLGFAFLLCSLFSMLIGSSFATASVMGVLLMTLARAGGVSPALTAGAVVSGSMVGDRSSHLSSGALLVARLCGCDHRRHIRNVLRVLPWPFFASLCCYAALSFVSPFGRGSAQTILSFRGGFNFGSIWILLPLFFVLLPMTGKVKLKHAVILSALAAAAVSFFVQGDSLADIGRYAVFGFRKEGADPGLTLLFGGGLMSMLRGMGIVLVSSALPPLLGTLRIFERMGNFFGAVAARTSPYRGAALAGLFASMIGCSQTLAIFLQYPLLGKIYPEHAREEKALAIADSSVTLSTYFPWNLVVSLPLAIMLAPQSSIVFNFFPLILALHALLREGGEATRLGRGSPMQGIASAGISCAR